MRCDYSNDYDYKRNVINYFNKNQVKLCHKCLLRFCNYKCCDYYKNCDNSRDSGETSVLDALIPRFARNNNNNNDNNALPSLGDVLASDDCFSCIGLLSNDYCHEIVDQIMDDSLSPKTCAHSFTAFQLQISLPVSVTLRNELIVAKLRHYFEANDHEMSVDLVQLFSVKDILRMILCHQLSAKLSVPFDSNSQFLVAINFSHDDSHAECQRLFELCPRTFFPKKCKKSMTESFVNRTSIVRTLDSIRSDIVIDWRLSGTATQCKVSSIVLHNESLFIAGRYSKFSRCLPQTPWILNGVRHLETSVEEIITAAVKQSIDCDDTKFSASGREDVDVRMLGRGRPFIVEIINPRRMSVTGEQLSRIQCLVNVPNSDIAVRDLQMANKDIVQSKLKEGESEKTKTYRAICCMSRPLTDSDIEKIAKIENLVLSQSTPIRVLHRRTLSKRPKHIHKLCAERIADHTIVDEKFTNDSIDAKVFSLTLVTEAGTYIKEFIHSDFGRTEPSLATLLGDCVTDIIQLDVMEINMDWPQVIDTNDC